MVPGTGKPRSRADPVNPLRMLERTVGAGSWRLGISDPGQLRPGANHGRPGLPGRATQYPGDTPGCRGSASYGTELQVFQQHELRAPSGVIGQVKCQQADDNLEALDGQWLVAGNERFGQPTTVSIQRDRHASGIETPSCDRHG